MSTSVQNGSTFSAQTDFKYTAPKANKSGGKSVGIQSVKDNKSLHLSTPLMMKWGVSEFVNKVTGNVDSYDMSLQFPREQDGNYNQETISFLAAMKEFEQKIKTDASTTKCKEWFGKPSMPEAVVDALFNPMLRYPKDKETEQPDLTREPTLRVKLPWYEKTFKCEIYNLDKEMIFPNPDDPELTPEDLIQKTQNVALVMQTGGVWFANGKFGVTWRLVQAVVKPLVSINGSNTCHVHMDEKTISSLKEEGGTTNEGGDSTQSHADTNSSATIVESSDSEGDQEPEQVVTPEPGPVVVAPPPVKKKVLKRKTVQKSA